MAYACEICGKGKQFGHNVPFSQKKTNKVWKPNLQKVRLELDGTKVRVKICAQCLRTLQKYRAQEASEQLVKADAKGSKSVAEKTAAKTPTTSGK